MDTYRDYLDVYRHLHTAAKTKPSDTTAPGVVTNLNSTSHTAGVTSPDPTVSFTWTRASDNYSGISGYGLFISTGGPGLPSQTEDIGDVNARGRDAGIHGRGMLDLRSRLETDPTDEGHFLDTLKAVGGNKTKAAEKLGIPRITLRRKAEKYGLG